MTQTHEVVGTKKFKKWIYLLTDGESKLQGEGDLDTIVDAIKSQDDMKMNIIAMDFCNDLEDSESDEEEKVRWDEDGIPVMWRSK